MYSSTIFNNFSKSSNSFTVSCIYSDSAITAVLSPIDTSSRRPTAIASK